MIENKLLIDGVKMPKVESKGSAENSIKKFKIYSRKQIKKQTNKKSCFKKSSV